MENSVHEELEKSLVSEQRRGRKPSNWLLLEIILFRRPNLLNLLERPVALHH